MPPALLPSPSARPPEQDRVVQSSGEWRKSLAEVDASVFKHMRDNIKGGFDEERFAPRVGFHNLKK